MKRLIQFGTAVAVCCCLAGCGGGGSPQAVAKAFAEIWDSEKAKIKGSGGSIVPDLRPGSPYVLWQVERDQKVKNYVASMSPWDNSYLAKKSNDDAYQLLKCEVTGNKATVEYTRKNELNKSVTILLMKIDGKWKVTGRRPH